MQFEEVKASILPQFFPVHWLDDIPEIVFSEFPSTIRIGYVLREEGGYSYLLNHDFNALGISLPNLQSFAIENLNKLPSARMTIARPPGGAEAFIVADDNFAAARILLPKVQERLAGALGDSYVLTLPHRDWCFCWSLCQLKDRQAKNASEALEDFINDDYRLTPDIILVTDGVFSIYKTQSPPLSDVCRMPDNAR